MVEPEKIIRPKQIAHLVIKTANLARLVPWYATFFNAEVVFSADGGAFLTYDDEHHRIAIIGDEGAKPKDASSAGIDHIAFTLGSCKDLAKTYLRLAEANIRPYWCINHGMTTSLYFRDPDGTALEYQVDNFATMEEARAFMSSDTFKKNPTGIEFDIEDFVREAMAA